MKWIMGILMFMQLIAVVGCASDYSQSSYQDKQVLQQYIQDHPDYYQKWNEELP